MSEPRSDFEKIASKNVGGNVLVDIFHFLKNNKKWWLLPILLILVLSSVLMLLSGTALAPFIYTLF